MSIQFRFNLQKAIETTSLILSEIVEEEISAWKLLRYIYLIERCALRDFDYPIVGGVSILRGTPINEDLYQILFWHFKPPESTNKNQKIWDKYYIVNRKSEEKVIQSRDGVIYDGDLNEDECNLIRNCCTCLRYLGLENTSFYYPEVELVEMNYQTLDNVKLLKILGKTDEEIEDIRLVSLHENYLDKMLGE